MSGGSADDDIEVTLAAIIDGEYPGLLDFTRPTKRLVRACLFKGFVYVHMYINTLVVLCIAIGCSVYCFNFVCVYLCMYPCIYMYASIHAIVSV